MQEEMFPMNDLTAILSSGEGGSPLPPADPVLSHVMEHGMTDMSEDDRPAIHISGSDGRIRSIADPSVDQPRERARLRSRLGPPPQVIEPRMTAREFLERQLQGVPQAVPTYPSPSPYMPMPAPMGMGAQVIVQAVDFNRGVLMTSHGAIPMTPETVSKIMHLSILTMREFFAESVNATMQAYNLGGKRRAKPKRKRPKKV